MSKNPINKSLYEAIFRKPEVFTELNPSNFPNVARDLSVEEERQLYAKDSHTNAGRLGHETRHWKQQSILLIAENKCAFGIFRIFEKYSIVSSYCLDKNRKTVGWSYKTEMWSDALAQSLCYNSSLSINNFYLCSLVPHNPSILHINSQILGGLHFSMHLTV